MGIPVSLILIAVGAILAFAVHQNPGASVDVDVDVVGWILMIVGIVGLLLSLLWWDRFGPGQWGWQRRPGPYGPGPGYGRRRTVVEDDVPPPGPPPP